jgi:hypothetical protein
MCILFSQQLLASNLSQLVQQAGVPMPTYGMSPPDLALPPPMLSPPPLPQFHVVCTYVCVCAMFIYALMC